MAQILILDEAAIAVLNGLREHAEANPFSREELLAIIGGQAPPIGERPGYCVDLPTGIAVALSIEQHPEKQYRHLSVSVNGRLPNPVLVGELMQYTGFINPLNCCLLYTEQNDRAMNVLELLGERMESGAWLPSPS